jgi:hypothetical protein
MKFRLIESYAQFIAVIHIDDEDGTWVKIDAPSPKAAVGFLIDEMKKQHPDANYIRVSIDNEVQTWERDIQLNSPEQKYSSANTSINSTKLPAIFNLVNFAEGTLNLDYGGGKFDNATQALAERGVSNLIYDPFNRSKEHNEGVIKTVRRHGGADSITCSNVLNVIAEEEVRLSVISNINKLLKMGGVAYFTVYEGDGSAQGKETSSGYQLNRKTTWYVDEIAQVFPNVQRKGKLIIAKK